MQSAPLATLGAHTAWQSVGALPPPGQSSCCAAQKSAHQRGSIATGTQRSSTRAKPAAHCHAQGGGADQPPRSVNCTSAPAGTETASGGAAARQGTMRVLMQTSPRSAV